jgi:hypothetical protein
MSTTKQTLNDIFEKAGIARAKTPDEVRRAGFALRRHLTRLHFAQLYVKNGFQVLATYREFNPRARGKYWRVNAWLWLRDPVVNRYIREIVQEATSGQKERVRVTVETLIAIGEMLITLDATELIEEVEYTDDAGRPKIAARFKPVYRLTPEQRMAVHRIRIRNGEVTAMEPYDRLKAQQIHVALLELLEQRGGSDQTWVQTFNRRMIQARKLRIDLETNGEKVMRLATRDTQP